MELLKEYSKAEYTASFQKICGIVPCGSGNPTVVTDNNNIQNGYVDQERVTGMTNGYHCHQRRNTGDNCGGKTTDHIPNGIHKDCVNSNGVIEQKPGIYRSKDGIEYFIANKSLYFLFRFGALLGNEEFFLTFFPFVMWNVDSAVGRQMVIVWVTVMYLGQVSKDIMQWPRPSSPPVVRLETEHSQEHGMPSTHAMAATAIPYTLFALIYSKYEISLLICIIIPVVWSLVCCLSRLYLGVHSISDVVGGVLFSLGIMVAYIPCLQKFDLYQQCHPYAPFVVTVLAIALCTVCYPDHKEGHNAKGNCIQVTASTAGMSVAVWLNYQLGLVKAVSHHGSYPISLLTWSWVWLSTIRFLTGVVAVVLTYTIMKTLSIRVFSYLVGLEKPDKKHPTVYTAYKFWTYFSLGFTILLIIPIVHNYFGIVREGFYAEVS